MKNYLYILCAFLLAFAGCTKDADVEPIAPAPDGNTQVVLTGFSGRGTRTGFGGAEDGAVPFLWSAGDYIWARNTRSEAIAEGGSQATFVFESLETADTYDVFYNLTGPAAATALIPAEQTQQAAGELNLGQNGDFGYATAQNGTFTLEHATSYVWFDTYSSDVTSNLLSITLSVSGGQTIAGEAAFADGKLGDCKGSSSVTLSFGEEGVALPSQSNDTDVFAAMVLYPADLSTATVSIVYKFADGSVYLQTKSGKTLTPGHTLRLSTQIAKSDCKSSGAFFMTEAGVAEELPTEPIGYLKVVTLGESQRVVGVSGIDYISNPYVASHKEQIGDVGYDGNMNYERLLSLSPDIVLLFGVSGASAMEPKLRELGIPYAYMGEYLEQSPLGKAEWLVAVAEIAGMRERGEEVFREIPLRYDSLKTLAAKAERKPVVMLNTPYGDSWLMAPPSSYVARLIADAGGQYVYTQDTGNQSRPIDTEEAYRLAEMSDCWINVGSAASLKELAEIVPKFMDTRPVREGRVYNNNRRTNPSGGNDYWESGVIHPDLILQDLIRIFHPELTDAEPTYYRKLN